MQEHFAGYILLILIIVGLVMLAKHLRIAYPIVLVLGGLVLSALPFLPAPMINPDLIFLIFLPPLLYEAAWQVSWKEFWRWKRVILSFAFPIVILTSSVVAVASVWLIPGFTLALGFLLGGIISPPDAVSATTIMRQVKVPRVILSMLEGESLLNDASSLIVYRFAVLAVITGQFSLMDASGSFFMVILLGVLVGVGVALIFYAMHRWLPTTAGTDIVLTLVTPYCMYYAAEHLHGSGVLAVVSGGLLLSSTRQRILSYQSRLQGENVWKNLVFVLNGIIFLLIGLQLRTVAKQLEDISLAAAIGYGLTISLVLIIVRLLSSLGASVFTRLMSHFITVANDKPGWRGPVVIGWAGMRGVVSLAAALAIPLTLPGGAPFPYRNLILFITFIVILVTLVVQGLTLPWVVAKVQVPELDNSIPDHDQDFIIQKKLAEHALAYLDSDKHRQAENEHLTNLRKRLQLDMRFFQQELEQASTEREQALLHFQTIYLGMLEHQRTLLNRINHKAEFDEDLIRKYMGLIDLEEHKLREKVPQFAPNV